MLTIRRSSMLRRLLASMQADQTASVHRSKRRSRIGSHRYFRSGAELVVEPLEARELLTVSVSGIPSWTELGASPILDAEEVDPEKASGGAVESVAVDPTNPARIFVGTVNGGVWRTTDGNRPFDGVDNDGANGVDDAFEQPTWTPLTDQLPSLAIGDIRFDPLDPTNNTLFAGTGSASSLIGSGGTSIGVLRTSDGGTTWKVIPVNPSGAEPQIRAVLPTTVDADPGTAGVQQVVLVGTTGGVYRSTDGGQTYSFISGTNGLGAGGVTHLVVDPNNASRIFVGVAGLGVYRSPDGGASWTAVNTNLTNLGTTTAIPLAAHPGGGTTVLYTITSGPNPAVYSTTDGGTNWTPLAALPASFTSNNNGLYNGAAQDQIVVDPTNSQIVYISKGYGGGGYVYRYDPAGAGNWVQIESAGASGNTAPHVDNRDLKFAGNSVLLDANDGGIFFLRNPQNAANNRWTSLHGRGATGMGVAEFHDVAWDSFFNVAVAGAQDNGTSVQSAAGSVLWRQFHGGDGGDVGVDALTLSGAGHTLRYASSQYLNGLTRYEFDTASHVAASSGILPDNGLQGMANGFISPLEVNATPPLAGQSQRIVVDGLNITGGTIANITALNPITIVDGGKGGHGLNTGDTVQISGVNGVTGANGTFTVTYINKTTFSLDGTNGAGAYNSTNPGSWQRTASTFNGGAVYESSNAGVAPNNNAVTWTRIPTAAGFGSGGAMAYGGRLGGVDNPDVLYVASGSQLFLRSTAGGTLTPTTTAFPGGSISDIALDPENWRHAFVADSNSVYETSNAGASWTDISGDLAETNIQTVEFVGSTGFVLVGGQLGVSRMRLSQPGQWTEFGLNLPNAAVFDLDYNATDDVLVAVPSGRGAWSVAAASIVLNEDPALQICGDESQVNQDDVFRLVRDANNPLLLNVFVNGVLEFTGPLAAIGQINVFGIGGNDNLIVDSSNGLIDVPQGIRYDGDGLCPGELPQPGYDRGFDTLTLVQTGGITHTSDTYSVGPQIGSGTHVIVSPGGATQTIFFEELEPVIDTVPAITQIVNATAEANAITYTQGGLVANGKVTIDNYESIEFSNKTNLAINALGGNDTVQLNNASAPAGLTQIAVDGGDGSDVITTGVDVPVPLQLTGGADNDTLDASSVLTAAVTLLGGLGNDVLVGGGGGDTLNGGDGDDVLQGNAGNNDYTGGVGFDTIRVRGTLGNDVIDATQTSGAAVTVVVNGSTRSETIATVEELLIQALSGDDVITAMHADTLVATPAASLRIHVSGDAPNASDRLVVPDDGLGDTMIYRVGADHRSGSITVGPLAPIVFDGIEYAQPLPGGTDGFGELLVFKPDPFESNNLRQTAWFLGSGATINVDPTIDPGPIGGAVPGDQDWFRFVAAETGTLDFQVFFREIATLANGRAGLPNNGNLDISVFDATGDLIGSSAGVGTDGERIAIPVVRNQTYFLQVRGAGAAINVYNFTVINVAAPIPFTVDLQAASDSGRSDTDNITNRDGAVNPAATFDIYLDDDRIEEFTNLGLVPGSDYIVQLFNNGVFLGNATFQGPGGGIANNSRWQYTITPGQLQEGHNNFLTAAVLIVDRATPRVSGRGSFSTPLQVTLDTIAPLAPSLLLSPPSDSGVAAFTQTLADRITRISSPEFTGRSEADTIVRLWADAPPISNGTINPPPDDVFEGLTVAVPHDGDEAFPNGQWALKVRFDLNDPSVGFPLDGLRQIAATAEDIAGNESPRVAGANGPTVLNIFVDTQGPQVTNVQINGSPAYNLFGTKVTTVTGPTPLVFALDVSFSDNPLRDVGFNYGVSLDAIITNPALYRVVGDHSGVIDIESVTLAAPQTGNTGEPGRARVVVKFAKPLPDDRFTLTINDDIVDPAGNKLDGESNAPEPQLVPTFPSGDLQPGGNFIARFTVDSRPEIADYAAGSVFVDINGNLVWDPEGQDNDHTNRDLTFTLQIAPVLQAQTLPMGVHDAVFAGKFPKVTLVGGGVVVGATDGFDNLAAYGFDPIVNGFRWLIDANHDGVVDPAAGDIFTKQPAGFQINGLPVAGNFDNNLANGDEIGLFDGATWWLDRNHDNVINAADVALGGKITTIIFGSPVVGDFDGDGKDDFATWRDNVFYFDLANDVLGAGAVLPINFGFPGKAEQPVAADMDQDGIDDVGLWTPRRSGVIPPEASEWYFLLSNDFIQPGAAHVVGSVATLNHPFSPTPLGHDLFAQFGDEFALPVVGNFDPPVSSTLALPASTNVGSVLGSAQLNGQSTSGQAWYRYSALRSGTMDVQVNAPRTAGDVRVDLYDANLQYVSTASLSAAGGYRSQQSVQPGSTYYVRVTGSNTGFGVQLSNQVPLDDLFDVSRDHRVSPLDVLQIINFLNGPEARVGDNSSLIGDRLYLDSNLDTRVTPLDALSIIDYINSRKSGRSSGGSDPGTPATLAAQPSPVPLTWVANSTASPETAEVRVADAALAAFDEDESGDLADADPVLPTPTAAAVDALLAVQAEESDDEADLLAPLA